MMGKSRRMYHSSIRFQWNLLKLFHDFYMLRSISLSLSEFRCHPVHLSMKKIEMIVDLLHMLIRLRDMVSKERPGAINQGRFLSFNNWYRLIFCLKSIVKSHVSLRLIDNQSCDI